MTLANWWLFFAAVFVLCGTPGPNMLHVLTRSVHFGLRRSIVAMAGCLAAMMLVLAASAAGLAALLRAFPLLFDVLRYAGVVYLLYLGVKAWRENAAPVDVGADNLTPALSSAQLFRGGLFIGLSNPKLLLFASAFLPQFINRAAPEGPQFAILVATFLATEMFWYAVYAMAGRKLARHLGKPGLGRAFNRLTGMIFVGFGLALFQARV